MNGIWQTSRRTLGYAGKTLIMGILNATPDSFSDGGAFLDHEAALRRASEMVEEGADIIDIGGESTRPGQEKERVSAKEEIRRVVPIIKSVSSKFGIPVSIDTCKSEVAEAAIDAGAEIINDISGLRFDEKIAQVAGESKAGLILMHLNGTFETMHRPQLEAEIISAVSEGFSQSLAKAGACGVGKDHVALDIGIGFSKTHEQNLRLLARLKEVQKNFEGFPILAGTSRKSFIGKILKEADASKRLSGSLASIAIAAWNGAAIVRVHDVKESREALRVVEAIRAEL